MTLLLKQLPTSEGPVKKKAAKDWDYCCLDGTSKQLLFLAPRGVQKIQIGDGLLAAKGFVEVTRSLSDVQLYVFSPSVFEVLDTTKPHYKTLRGQLIPYLLRSQFKAQQASDDQSSGGSALAAGMTSTHSSNKSVASRLCYAYTLQENTGFCVNINSVPDYISGNLELAKAAAPIEEGRFPKNTVGADCMVGEETELGQRCSVKRSVVGKHCSIGASVRLNSSVLMDKVVVAEQTTLEFCVLADGASIGSGCQLKHCTVEAGFEVPANTIVEGKSFMEEEQ